MEEIEVKVNETQNAFDAGIVVGMAVGTVFTVACYLVGRGIGTVYCNLRDRHDMRKIAKRMPKE